jgi:hypothetical protein
LGFRLLSANALPSGHPFSSGSTGSVVYAFFPTGPLITWQWVGFSYFYALVQS